MTRPDVLRGSEPFLGKIAPAANAEVTGTYSSQAAWPLVGIHLALLPIGHVVSYDLLALQRHRAAITDDPVPLLAISRSGVEASGLDASYGPVELLRAWRRRTAPGQPPVSS